MSRQALVLEQLNSLEGDLMAATQDAGEYKIKSEYALGKKQSKVDSLTRQAVPLLAFYNEAFKLYIKERKIDQVLAAYGKFRTKELRDELLFVYTKLIPFAKRELKDRYELLKAQVAAAKEGLEKGKTEIAEMKKTLRDYSGKISEALN